MIGHTLSHYRIDGLLGQGGMGVVYRARDLTLERPVALKFLPPELTSHPDARHRLVREARAAAALDHPNICPVYEIGESGGQMFIAMALLEGQMLRDRIDQGPLPIADAVRVAREVAEGLRAAHARGIIHRDIKPGNIMLTAAGPARILDFGLAHTSSHENTTRSASMLLGGTIAYMSPEQACGEVLDHRTDLWSLGCVLYEMLTGQPPFTGANALSLLRKITETTPRGAETIRPEIPAALSRVIERALEKDVSARFADASVMIAALDEAAAPPAARERAPAIAVLPFLDMSPAKDQEYFCDGITEELINALAHVSELRVVARTSAFAFKGQHADIREIGRRLDVTQVLEGSIRKAGNRLRITAQLISTSDGCHLWSERFDRNADDIFEVQDEVSSAVVRNLRVTLLAQERARLEKRHTKNPDAYNLYLKGTQLTWKVTVECFDQALDCFRKAVELDSRFAAAYAGMARVHETTAMLSFVAPRQSWEKARPMLEKALALDSDLAEAHCLAGQLALYSDFDFARADASLQRALSINPGMAEGYAWLAWVNLARCRFDEAVACMKRAQGLDPLMLPLYAMCVGVYWMSAQYELALEEFERVKEIDATPGLGHFHAAVAHFQLGQLDEAEALLRLPPPAGAFSGWGEALLARIAVRRGRLKEAREMLEALVERGRTAHVSPFTTAIVLQDLGERDRAFEFYQIAYEQRDALMALLATQLAIGFLPPDERFEPFLRKLGVTPALSTIPRRDALLGSSR